MTKPEHVLNRIREVVNSDAFADFVLDDVQAMNVRPEMDIASDNFAIGGYMVDITIRKD